MRIRVNLWRIGLLCSAIFVSLALAESAACCLLPEEPGEYDSDGPEVRQMPVSDRVQSDAESYPPRQGQSRIVVEQWFGNHLRVKRFNGYSNYEARDYGARDYSVDRQPVELNWKLAHTRIKRNQPSLTSYQRSNQLPFGSWFSQVENGNTDDSLLPKPDRFVDTPQIDADGVRHFSNGKHFDLSKMSLDQAIDSRRSSASDFSQPQRHPRRAY